jgi:hypothetical protein
MVPRGIDAACPLLTLSAEGVAGGRAEVARGAAVAAVAAENLLGRICTLTLLPEAVKSFLCRATSAALVCIGPPLPPQRSCSGIVEGLHGDRNEWA